MDKVIEAVNVSYIYQTKYQKTKALSEVSCSFERGKVYAITGKSGSGKSTFLSLLAGLDVPTEGTLNIGGEDMRKINRDIYRLNKASVISQAFYFYHSGNHRQYKSTWAKKSSNICFLNPALLA